jgi:hypothetical protein
MRVSYDVAWNPVLGASNFYQEPYGAVLYQKNPDDRTLADAIGKIAKIKISHIYTSTIPDTESLAIGIRP